MQLFKQREAFFCERLEQLYRMGEKKRRKTVLIVLHFFFVTPLSRQHDIRFHRHSLAFAHFFLLHLDGCDFQRTTCYMSKIQTELDTVLLHRYSMQGFHLSFLTASTNLSSLWKSPWLGQGCLQTEVNFKLKDLALETQVTDGKAGLFPSKNKERHFQEGEGARVFHVSGTSRVVCKSKFEPRDCMGSNYRSQPGHLEGRNIFDSQRFDHAFDGERQMKKSMLF